MSRIPTVSVVRCALQASEGEVKGAVARAIAGLGAAPEELIGARRILVKPNAAGMDLRTFGGRPVSVVDPALLAGVVAWIRERTSAQILIVEGQHYVPMAQRYREVGYEAALAEYGVRFIDATDFPFAEFDVPGGGLMFSSYTLSAELAEVDVTVSVAKMKAHMGTGATGTLKNLFGLAPNDVYGGPLRYLHAPVRLPRVLVDLGLIGTKEAGTKLNWVLDNVSVPYIQAGACKGLAILGDREAIPKVVANLESNNQVVRTWAARSLGYYRDLGAVPRLIERIEAEKTEEVRALSVVSLGIIGEVAEEMPVLRRISDHCNWMPAETYVTVSLVLRLI